MSLPIKTKNDRLFVGKIPLTIEKRRIKTLLSSIYPEATEIELYDGRGFAFLQFKDENDAKIAKERNNGKLEIEGTVVMIKWANKEDSTADPNIMSKIANLFVRGFDDSVTEMQLREAFGGVEGGVQRCHIEKKSASLPFAFILFATRQQAEVQMNSWNGKILNSSILSVQWARPPAATSPKYHPYSRVTMTPSAVPLLPFTSSPLVQFPLPSACPSFPPLPLFQLPSSFDPLLIPQTIPSFPLLPSGFDIFPLSSFDRFPPTL